MSYYKKIFFLFFIIIINFFVLVNKVDAYDDKIAHPNIAKMATEVFNSQNNNSLSSIDIELIMKGAIEEDTPIRWFNHFYDPVHNEGLFFNDEQYQTSKQWATNSEDQSTYGKGDNTWYRAIDDYKKGNREAALIELGHIVHLVSDMGVPAHTRNDSHADEISYEDFVKNNWQSIANDLDKNFEIKELNSLEQAFDELAKYSNGNFYTQDTLEVSKYGIVKITGYKNIGDRMFAKNGDIFLYKIKKDIYAETKQVNDEDVFKNNAHYLIPKTIEYSAGVIQLFFEEVNDNEEYKLSDVRLKIFTKNKLKGALVGGALTMDDSMFNVFGKMIYAGKVTNIALAEGQQQIKNVYNYAIDSVKDNLSKITFDQILASMPSLRVVSVPQTTAPIVPPTEMINQTVADERFFVVPLRNDTESPKPTESKQEKYTSEPQFVFGPGGEKTPSAQVVLAPIVQVEIIPVENSPTSTATTEDIIETPTSTEPVVETDTIPPDAPSLNISFAISTSTTTSSTIDVSWQSTANDLVGYNMDFKKDSEDWINILPLTTSTKYQMIADKFHEYVFRVNAIDTNTNTSAWSEKSVLVDYPKTVIINEIAWMGTASNRSQDEWIELYNNTDQDINLANWKIKATNNYLTWNNASSTIKAHDYFLLERTNDTTVSDFVADGRFSLSGGLNNSGENLVLSNNNGDVIDQVDNSDGWFVGQKDTKYKTMERINSNKPGTQASNWQTSDTFSYKGKGQGGVRIYGTPRQPNKGYWYLQNLTTNYTFDENNTLILTEENSPYFIDDKTEIPAGYTLTLKEGVIMIGAFNSSYISVKGNLIIEGTLEKPVIFTSSRDTNYVSKNYSNLPDGNPEAGDWSRIEVSENGKLIANNVKFFYGGQKYFAQGGFVFGGKFPARIINNLGGEVNLNNAVFQNNFTNVEEKDQTYDALVWIEPATGLFTTTTINNSIFDGGYVAIKNQKQNNYLSVSNSTFKNFTNSNGTISAQTDLPIMENNVFENNARNVVELKEFVVNKDIVLDAKIEYLTNGITINTGATLKILPGAKINLLNRADIAVNGNLEALGTESEKIVIRSVDTGEYWGNMIFVNSTSTLQFVEMSGGNYGSINTPQGNGMLWMKDSNIILDHVLLSDARRPYNMIYSKDSNLRMKDSKISWLTPKEPNGQNIDGIKIDGGSLYLNNTIFDQMDRGIEFYGITAVELENMSLEHFTNISDLNWWPIDVITL